MFYSFLKCMEEEKEEEEKEETTDLVLVAATRRGQRAIAHVAVALARKKGRSDTYVFVHVLVRASDEHENLWRSCGFCDTGRSRKCGRCVACWTLSLLRARRRWEAAHGRWLPWQATTLPQRRRVTAPRLDTERKRACSGKPPFVKLRFLGVGP